MSTQEILLAAGGSILLAIAGAIAAIVRAYTNKLVAKIENDETRERVKMLRDEAFAIVAELSQTMVPEIRKAAEDGRITPDEREGLRNVALEKLRARFSREWLEELCERLRLDESGMTDMMIGNIEAQVWRQKMEMGKTES